VEKNKTFASQFPKWSATLKKLINLEDQIIQCSEKTSKPYKNLEDPDVLALSALLHQQSKNQTILLRPNNQHKDEWQKELQTGAELFIQRMGRMNLACTHCHDQNIGKRMQADIISPGHPTGFPIFKMSWQSMGSLDRRIRACYSGVQADIPPAGSQDLRRLELFLKMRAEGLSIEGPSLRR
jgi:sulfur-oxidizing protein SoxA